MPTDLDIRKELVRLVETYPGLHLRELAREADISEALAGYHLDRLEDDDHIRSETEGGFRRFYPVDAPGPSEAEQELLSVLRREAPLQIVVFLLEEREASHKEITAQLDRAKSTVSYHLDTLREEEIVEQTDEGRFRLREPRRVERVLIRWEPPSDLTDRFASLWQRFYYHD